MYLSECLSTGTWSVDVQSISCSLPDCPDPRKFNQAHAKILDPFMKLVGVGVNVEISGLNENDLANITCRQESSYIINTDSQSVQARCLNGSWTGNWEANFNYDGEYFIRSSVDSNFADTNGQTNIFLGLMNPIFNLNGSLPGCFRDEPKFENLEKCEVGCQVGTCLEANNTIGIVDGFKCECGPAHYGFNCKESTRLKVKNFDTL